MKGASHVTGKNTLLWLSQFPPIRIYISFNGAAFSVFAVCGCRLITSTNYIILHYNNIVLRDR